MKRSILLFSAMALVLGFAARSDGRSGSQRPPQKIQAAQVQLHRMGAITRNQLLQQVNKIVKIEGYYYDGSIPMVIDDMERVKIDMVLPPDSYVPIVGPRPVGLRAGDKITVQGTIQRPTAQDPQSVRRESLVIRVAAAQSISRLQAATLQIAQRPFQVGAIRVVGGISVGPRQVKYAVLIAGGANPGNNHQRYWNDLSTMYGILRASGYNASNIYVLYADGAARDASMPVNYSATRANIATVFNLLASKMSSLDKLYIMTNDHGAGILTTAVNGYSPGIYGGVNDSSGDEAGESYSEATYHTDMSGDGDQNDSFRVDEVLNLWYDQITDDQFAAEVNKITNYGTMIIQMKQCFSGGFVADLTRPNRIVMSSASPTQISWAHSSLQYGEFTYWYFAALTGNKPDGSGAVNADTNGDGKVSILEAYNFARSHDTASETPFYEDNGATPAHSGAVPSGGDGTLGQTIFL
jgi:hypothetical protein